MAKQSRTLTGQEKETLREMKKNDPSIKELSRHQQIKAVRAFIENNGVKKVKSNFRGEALLEEEIEEATNRYEEYRDNYNITSISDLQLLETLVYWEIMELRFKKAISESFKSAQEIVDEGLEIEVGTVIDKDTTKAFKDSTDMIMKMKEKIGLLKEKKTEDDYTTFEKMQKKVDIWAKTNVSERTWVCKHCSGMNVLYVNPEYWNKEASKHPHYKGKVLFNEEVIRLNLKAENLKDKLGTLKEDLRDEILDCLVTQESVGKILESSPDYTNWLIKKGWVVLDSYKEITKEING